MIKQYLLAVVLLIAIFSLIPIAVKQMAENRGTMREVDCETD